MYLLGQLSLWLPVKNVPKNMFRLKTLSIFTKCMSYLYVIKKLCLKDMTYFKLNCYILGKVFKSKQHWILLSLKSQTPLIPKQSDIKRLNNIIMTHGIITVGKLHVRQKNNIMLSYLPVNHPQQQIHTLFITRNSRFTPC